MTAGSDERVLTLTASSIDGVSNTLTAVAALVGGDTDPAEVRVELSLSDEEVERVETHIRADRYTVGSDGDVPSAPPVEAAADKDSYERGPKAHDTPRDGEVQPSPVAFDPPKNGTIQYAALALVCYQTTADGDSWVTSNETIDLHVCPYGDNQIRSALSHLWRKRGCLTRRGAADARAHTVEYRPTKSSRQHVQREGKFPWPDDADAAPGGVSDPPFFTQDE